MILEQLFHNFANNFLSFAVESSIRPTSPCLKKRAGRAPREAAQFLLSKNQLTVTGCQFGGTPTYNNTSMFLRSIGPDRSGPIQRSDQRPDRTGFEHRLKTRTTTMFQNNLTLNQLKSLNP